MLEKGSELYTIWANCFKVFDNFIALMDEEPDSMIYWTKVHKTITQLADKYKDSKHYKTYMSLSLGVYNALVEEWKNKKKT